MKVYLHVETFACPRPHWQKLLFCFTFFKFFDFYVLFLFRFFQFGRKRCPPSVEREDLPRCGRTNCQTMIKTQITSRTSARHHCQSLHRLSAQMPCAFFARRQFHVPSCGRQREPYFVVVVICSHFRSIRPLSACSVLHRFRIPA